jgi:glutathione peroxidase
MNILLFSIDQLEELYYRRSYKCFFPLYSSLPHKALSVKGALNRVTIILLARKGDGKMAIYDFKVETIQGEHTTLGTYEGKVLLIVNTASKCGFTPQYTGLQSLYDSYKEKGFEVLGFPCNQFGAQEPGTNNEISEFCQLNYDVSFPLFKKVKVNGEDAHPLFKNLSSEAPGILGSKAIKWNFTKFLVDRSGRVVKRFAPTDKPEAIEKHIQELL